MKHTLRAENAINFSRFAFTTMLNVALCGPVTRRVFAYSKSSTIACAVWAFVVLCTTLVACWAPWGAPLLRRARERDAADEVVRLLRRAGDDECC